MGFRKVFKSKAGKRQTAEREELMTEIARLRSVLPYDYDIPSTIASFASNADLAREAERLKIALETERMLWNASPTLLPSPASSISDSDTSFCLQTVRTFSPIHVPVQNIQPSISAEFDSVHSTSPENHEKDREIVNVTRLGIKLAGVSILGIMLLILTCQLSTLITNCLYIVTTGLMSPHVTWSASAVVVGVCVAIAAGALAKAHINHSDNARWVAERSFEIRREIDRGGYGFVDTWENGGAWEVGSDAMVASYQAGGGARFIDEDVLDEDMRRDGNRVILERMQKDADSRVRVVEKRFI